MILASNPDRAVTVRERDPTYPGNDVPGGPRGALVDEVNGDSICDQIPLPHGHGSVNFRFSMIPSSLKFQLSSSARPSHCRLEVPGGYRLTGRDYFFQIGSCLRWSLQVVTLDVVVDAIAHHVVPVSIG